MSPKQDSDLLSDTLSLLERGLLELFAEGFGECEVAIRLGMSRREISVIRSHTAKKIAARTASAHPFRIQELILARELDSTEG